MEKKSYSSTRDINSARLGDISFGLINRGVPMGLAFSLAQASMFLRKGNPVRVDHYKEIKLQIAKKLKTHFWQGIHLGEIRSLDNLAEETPDPIKEKVGILLNQGYNYFVQTKGNYYMARTGHSGHKVLQIRNIFN